MKRQKGNGKRSSLTIWIGITLLAGSMLLSGCQEKKKPVGEIVEIEEPERENENKDENTDKNTDENTDENIVEEEQNREEKQDSLTEEEGDPFGQELTENETEEEEERIIIDRQGEEQVYTLSEEDDTVLLTTNLYYPLLRFPENPEAETSINRTFTDRIEEDAKQVEEYLQMAREQYEMLTESDAQEALEYWGGYAYDRDYIISYEGENILSIRELVYTYLGGAHPNNALLTWNFDLNTGELLALSDLAKEKEDFSALLEQAVLDYLANCEANMAGMFYEDYEKTVRESIQNPVWYISEGNIWIVFNAYEIAPYAAGIIEIPLPLSDWQEVLDPL